MSASPPLHSLIPTATRPWRPPPASLSRDLASPSCPKLLTSWKSMPAAISTSTSKPPAQAPLPTHLSRMQHRNSHFPEQPPPASRSTAAECEYPTPNSSATPSPVLLLPVPSPLPTAAAAFLTVMVEPVSPSLKACWSPAQRLLESTRPALSSGSAPSILPGTLMSDSHPRSARPSTSAQSSTTTRNWPCTALLPRMFRSLQCPHSWMTTPSATPSQVRSLPARLRSATSPTACRTAAAIS